MGWIPGHGKCDACGAGLTKEPEHASLIVYGPPSWDEDNDHAVLYEWWSEGTYCRECLDKLVGKITSKIPVTERYGRGSIGHDGLIAQEVSLILGGDE